jgi:hypothetical protein
VLADHQLDGVPVLPFALAMELLAREAVREYPGARLVGLDDVRVLQGVRLDQPMELTPRLSSPVDGESQITATVELLDPSGRVRVRGLAVLLPQGAPDQEVPAPLDWPEGAAPYPCAMDGIYGKALFHGPAFQCIREVPGCWESGITALVAPTPAPRLWQPGSAAEQWLVDPLLVDGVFQALILWCRVATGAPSLPSRVARLRMLRPWGTEPVRVVATVRRRRGANVLSDVDLLGEDGALIARIDGYTCTAAESLEAAFRAPSGPAPLSPPA